jgi:hypothetical protein
MFTYNYGRIQIYIIIYTLIMVNNALHTRPLSNSRHRQARFTDAWRNWEDYCRPSEAMGDPEQQWEAATFYTLYPDPGAYEV